MIAGVFTTPRYGLGLSEGVEAEDRLAPDFAWRIDDDDPRDAVGLLPPSLLRSRMLYLFLAANEVRLGKCSWTMSLQLRPICETRWSNLVS